VRLVVPTLKKYRVHWDHHPKQVENESMSETTNQIIKDTASGDLAAVDSKSRWGVNIITYNEPASVNDRNPRSQKLWKTSIDTSMQHGLLLPSWPLCSISFLRVNEPSSSANWMLHMGLDQN
jgi:hypothetical protein